MTRSICVFLASTGDVEEERHAFREILQELSSNTSFQFTPTGFEDALAATGPLSQAAINKLVDDCDVFVAVFHRRWGQPAPETAVYTSCTEEEFERANRRFGESGIPEIFCFFKHVDLASLADPGEQLSRVLEFRRRLEESRRTLYRTFTTVAEFRIELRTHLLAFSDGQLPTERVGVRRIHLPILADRQPETERAHDLAAARQAQLVAERGRIEEAALLFARLTQTTINMEALDAARQFFEQVGNTDAAQAVLEKKLTLLQNRRLAAHEYAAIMDSHPWLDDVVSGIVRQVPDEQREMAERIARRLFKGTRFHELLIESMAERFTVGELLSLARFCRGEGGSVAAKFGSYMGLEVPRIIALLADENHELFN
jgi:hypothetical protein